MKRLFIVLLFGVMFFRYIPVNSFAKTVQAKTVQVTTTIKPTASSAPTPQEINSFELFWPMSAGKTMESKVYSLKILKEKVRGFLIFGSAQKANYNMFLSIKRMLEAESLMKANNNDLANKTIDSAINDLEMANGALTNAKNSSDIDQNVKDEINTRLSNLKEFNLYLMVKYPTFKDKLQKVSDKLNSIIL